MKKGMTIDEQLREIEIQKARIEAFRGVIKYLDSEIEWKCPREVETEGFYEKWTDDEGNEQKTWHSTVYKIDDNGDYVRNDPKEGDYNYDEWMTLKAIKEEILAII